MKLNIVVACIFFSIQFLSSQTLTLDTKNNFGFKVPSLINSLTYDKDVQDLDFNLLNDGAAFNFTEDQHYLNAEKLNEKLFSSFRIIESTYLKY